MKHLFTILFTVVALFSNAQFIKKLSLDLNVGGRFGGAVSDSSYASYEQGSDSVKAVLSPGIHIDGGVRYQLNELISIRGGIAYDGFNTTRSGFPDSTNDNSSLISGTIEAVVNLKKLKFMSFIPEKIGLNFHAGLGLSTMSNSNVKKFNTDNNITPSDPGLKGNDDMINIVFGLTPQYKLNDKISINLDLSTKLLVKQSLYVNPGQDSRVNDKMGNIFNVAVGATYKF
jgi:OOP family OmpA-OmpF porin